MGEGDQPKTQGKPYEKLLLVGVALVLIVGVGFIYQQLNDYPAFSPQDELALSGLTKSVTALQRDDGLWTIRAETERDAMQVQGYLMARDRLFQMDLFRHMAQGRLTELLGNREMNGKTTLDQDLYHRALALPSKARLIYDNTSAGEREQLQAFVEGVNQWIAEDQPALEHRLLGVDNIRPWTAIDSLSIYAFLMQSLSGNADREIRRLLIACEVGLEGLETVWPTHIEFDPYVIPDPHLPDGDQVQPPAVAPELRSLDWAAWCGHNEAHSVTEARWPRWGLIK